MKIWSKTEITFLLAAPSGFLLTERNGYPQVARVLPKLNKLRELVAVYFFLKAAVVITFEKSCSDSAVSSFCVLVLWWWQRDCKWTRHWKIRTWWNYRIRHTSVPFWSEKFLALYRAEMFWQLNTAQPGFRHQPTNSCVVFCNKRALSRSSQTGSLCAVCVNKINWSSSIGKNCDNSNPEMLKSFIFSEDVKPVVWSHILCNKNATEGVTILFTKKSSGMRTKITRMVRMI